ncbi:FMN-binding glutamate synthase family protein [Auraticoccus monumenti]|uniref:Glutamate synthase domain-containing protein 2 n=1 Tax=Auraticoccus monumenti TaxID=675864 RepID=A0A1G6SM41_9ACTN|nr:FMN-binding glutamate synthase family protein [Auraticoccus monumenti]SDD17701.1 Glutamate synthase domain-containing protein 2 [Auraticoccus monumenti]
MTSTSRRRARLAAALPAAALAGVAVHDLVQRRHAVLRNFPVLGRARYLLEKIGPELRQYIVAGNDEERPFSRDQRRWVYSSAKLENNYFGFGTDNDVEHGTGWPVILHRTFPDPVPVTAHHEDDRAPLPSAKVLGGPRGRRHAFRPESVVNISAMSFGSLSGAAVRAMNAGAALAGSLHNTGEGGLSEHHRQGGGLVLQIGTGYFGCRDADGRLDLDALTRVVESAPVRAIEIKLSQGAKPGLGGVLPAAKVTPEIAAIRGIPLGQDCVSPSRHSAFGDVDQMLDVVEEMAARTGLPVGVKSAVGEMSFWHRLVELMADGQRGVDFVTVDGGEGGTGAAPLIFSDSVALPFRAGFARVQAVFTEAGLAERVTFIGAGKLGLPDNALVAFALGADMVNVGREAMLAVGCIQAQKCHTDTCPTGVATQSRWLQRGLDPELKSVRLANYVRTLRRDLLKVSHACGVAHPGLITTDLIELMDGPLSSTSLTRSAGYRPGWGLPSAADRAEIVRLMTRLGEEPEHRAQGSEPVDSQRTGLGD